METLDSSVVVDKYVKFKDHIRERGYYNILSLPKANAYDFYNLINCDNEKRHIRKSRITRQERLYKRRWIIDNMDTLEEIYEVICGISERSPSFLFFILFIYHYST